MTQPEDRSQTPVQAGPGNRRFFDTPAGWLLCVFAAGAGALIWFDHREHILPVLPYLVLPALCIGMHLLMHRGHGGHGGPGGDR